MKEKSKGMLRELMQHRNRLWALAFSMTRNFHLSEDIIQEVSVAIMSSTEKFDSQKAFLPWALGITRNQTLKALRRTCKEECPISDENLNRIQENLISNCRDEPNLRFYALRHCLNELSEENRQTMTLKYVDRLSAEEIALKVKRSPTAVFSLLQRLRYTLAKCIKSQLEDDAIYE